MLTARTTPGAPGQIIRGEEEERIPVISEFHEAVINTPKRGVADHVVCGQCLRSAPCPRPRASEGGMLRVIMDRRRVVDMFVMFPIR